MASTTFVAGTVYTSAWGNEVNTHVFGFTGGIGEVSVKAYGALGDGTTDDSVAIQAAITAASAAGGGIVTLEPGKTYFATVAPVLANKVVLDGQWARLNLTLSTGSIYGIRVVTQSGVRRLRCYVTSTGSPSAQYIFHAPISIGASNNNGDTVASPNAFQTAHSWFIEDVELGNSRNFGPVIQGMGDIYNGVIRNVYIPTSSTCSGIHFDWGNVGTVSSAAIPTTRTAFDANQCYTTHPHNITIENVDCGNLSKAASGDLGTNIVRLSACHSIKMRNLRADNVTLTGFRHVGGDLGYEFAPAAVKPMACKGNTVDGVSITAAAANATAYGLYIDTFADNVYNEPAYTPLINPLMHGNVVVKNADMVGPNGATQYGARIIQARGVTIKDSTFQKWEYGIWVDEFAQDINIENNEIFANRLHGCVQGFGLFRETCSSITWRANKSYGNGTAGTGYGFYMVRGQFSRWLDNEAGTLDEATQGVGFAMVDGPNNYMNDIEGNHVWGSTVGAYALGASTPVQPHWYRQLGSFSNNSASPGNPLFVGGQSFVPFRSLLTGAVVPHAHFTSNSSSAPTDGTWYRGDKLVLTSPTAANPNGFDVVTSGTFGTLAGLTNATTTNGLTTSVMSLAARTVDAVVGNYTLTNLSVTTNIRAGLLVSVAGGVVTNARVLSISGTTLQIDKPVQVAATAAALTTAGVVEGEVVTINSTPVTTGIVKSISGTTVTLSGAAASTESGRTVTYVTPVFKALPAIAA